MDELRPILHTIAPYAQGVVIVGAGILTSFVLLILMKDRKKPDDDSHS